MNEDDGPGSSIELARRVAESMRRVEKLIAAVREYRICALAKAVAKYKEDLRKMRFYFL